MSDSTIIRALKGAPPPEDSLEFWTKMREALGDSDADDQVASIGKSLSPEMVQQLRNICDARIVYCVREQVVMRDVKVDSQVYHRRRVD